MSHTYSNLLSHVVCKRTFQEEFVELLAKHGIDYDPKFVFD